MARSDLCKLLECYCYKTSMFAFLDNLRKLAAFTRSDLGKLVNVSWTFLDLDREHLLSFSRNLASVAYLLFKWLESYSWNPRDSTSRNWQNQLILLIGHRRCSVIRNSSYAYYIVSDIKLDKLRTHTSVDEFPRFCLSKSSPCYEGISLKRCTPILRDDEIEIVGGGTTPTVQ